MTKQEKIQLARATRIQELLALNGRGGLEVTQLDEDTIGVRHRTWPILLSQGEELPVLSQHIYFEYSLPAGFPLEAKPIVYFPEPEHTPWSPNVFESRSACIGNFYTSTTLVYLTRKLLLEAILDPNTVNPDDAANARMRRQYLKIINGETAVDYTLPLMDPQKVYRLIPEADGDRYRRPGVRSGAAPGAVSRRRPRMN